MSANPQNPFTKFDAFILIAFLLFCAAGVIVPKVRERREAAEKARIEEARERENQRLLEQTLQRMEAARIRDSIEAPMRRVRDSIAKAQLAEQEALKKKQAEETRQETLRKRREYEANAGYNEGYHDGYECGYDDGDCNESYGYSYLSDETLARHTHAYRRGFDAGYRAGIIDGREDFEYDHGL